MTATVHESLSRAGSEQSSGPISEKQEMLDHFSLPWYNAAIGHEGEQRLHRRVSREKGWPWAGSRPKRAGEIRSGAAALKEK